MSGRGLTDAAVGPLDVLDVLMLLPRMRYNIAWVNRVVCWPIKGQHLSAHIILIRPGFLSLGHQAWESAFPKAAPGTGRWHPEMFGSGFLPVTKLWRKTTLNQLGI